MTHQEKIQYLKNNGVRIGTTEAFLPNGFLWQEARGCVTCGSKDFAIDLYHHASDNNLNVPGISVLCAVCISPNDLDLTIAHSNELQKRMNGHYIDKDVKITYRDKYVKLQIPTLKDRSKNNEFRRRLHELGFSYIPEGSAIIYSDMICHPKDIQEDTIAKLISNVERIAWSFDLSVGANEYGGLVCRS